MRNRSNIFNVIKRLSLFLAWHSTQRFPGIDSFENTETTEIFDGDLQHFDASRASNETRFQTGVFPLLLLSHARQLALGSSGRTERRLDGRLLWTALDAVSHG